MGKHGWERLWGGGGRNGEHSPMKSGARQHEDTDERVRQRTESCRSPKVGGYQRKTSKLWHRVKNLKQER